MVTGVERRERMRETMKNKQYLEDGNRVYATGVYLILDGEPVQWDEEERKYYTEEDINPSDQS